MSFLRKLFGRNPPPPNSAPSPAGEKQFRAVDKFGREVLIGERDWRESVLPATIKSHWNDPEQLAGIISSAIDDEFFQDVLAAAERLAQIDPIPSRSASTLSFVLLRLGRIDEAEKILRAFLKKHGENAYVLTHLAKVFAQRKNDAEAEKLLWRALELDPNQENPLLWLASIHRERSGAAGERATLEKIANLPQSWRAQLWLARSDLSNRQLDAALARYRECLSRAPTPPPSDLLMQISGDLGNHGHLPELLSIVHPVFDPKTHGLRVGNNIVKALVDLGQLDAAARVLNQLHALKSPDWDAHLSYWETEIAKARVAISQPAAAEPLQMSLVPVEGPVWLKPSSPARELFPAKTSVGPTIAFLCFSGERPTNSQKIERQLADTLGRLTRALPLFLAEQADFSTNARVQTLIPWIINGGFVLSGGPWDDESAASHARGAATPNDYVVTGHLKSNADVWPLELRLIRTIDAKCLASLRSIIDPAKPQNAVPGLTDEFLKTLVEHADAERLDPPAIYQPPVDDGFGLYLLRLEQLLAVRCAGMETAHSEFLSGEREIIAGNIHLCLARPANVPLRILLAQTLLAMKRVRPDILPEFKEKIALLRQERPLPEMPDKIVQRLIDEAFSG